ncbi:hypothetical protein BJ875DRAFT_187281 [Amylocarpus encephaloides]|uniref:Uncharacterized protein n=1 Tax=Amylocarpus encephaloides TaxID=45428 RepID=A0A9P7Y9C9_9HELO|nr:hypothetical protein BJ875DRAFT_187281 [Amylocarpus encephaloides]
MRDCNMCGYNKHTRQIRRDPRHDLRDAGGGWVFEVGHVPLAGEAEDGAEGWEVLDEVGDLVAKMFAGLGCVVVGSCCVCYSRKLVNYVLISPLFLASPSSLYVVLPISPNLQLSQPYPHLSQSSNRSLLIPQLGYPHRLEICVMFVAKQYLSVITPWSSDGVEMSSTY